VNRRRDGEALSLAAGLYGRRRKKGTRARVRLRLECAARVQRPPRLPFLAQDRPRILCARSQACSAHEATGPPTSYYIGAKGGGPSCAGNPIYLPHDFFLTTFHFFKIRATNYSHRIPPLTLTHTLSPMALPLEPALPHHRAASARRPGELPRASCPRPA
jgi:hypothetical protein